MSEWLLDSSVLLKWFHSEGEAELEAARALRTAHVLAHVEVRILDLAVYEVGNVLTRSLRWSAVDIADQVEDLLEIVGPPVTMTRPMRTAAASLAGEHRLTYYDAAWAAAAAELGIPLVSADRQLLAGGLARTATDVARTVGLMASE